MLVALGLINLAEVLPLLEAFGRLSGDAPIVSSHTVPQYESSPLGVIVIDADRDGMADTAYVDVDRDGYIDQVTPWPPPEAPAPPAGTFEPLDHGPGSEYAPPEMQPPPGTFEPLDAESATSTAAAPDGPIEPVETERVGGFPRARWSDTDGDGFVDRVELDTDDDGSFDTSSPWVDPLMPPPPTMPTPPTVFPDVPAGGLAPPSEVSAQPAGPTSAEPESDGSVGASLPSDGLDVSQQEIDDIYRRGLAPESGRSLDELRDDIAALSQARGGSTEVGNPYGLAMRPTAAGPSPLTPGEFADYNKARADLARLLRERDGQQRAWDDYLTERQRWRERNPLQAAEDVWNAETQFQERMDAEGEWVRTWEAWLRGNRFRAAPDGSSYEENFGRSSHPDFAGDDDQFARGRIKARYDKINDIERERMAYMAAARDRPNIGEEGARLDAVQRELLERRRVLSEPINRARDRMSELQSYRFGRSLPGNGGSQ